MRKNIYAEDDGWTRRKVNQDAVWACKIIKIDGGWLAFESWDDYQTHVNQK